MFLVNCAVEENSPTQAMLANVIVLVKKMLEKWKWHMKKMIVIPEQKIGIWVLFHIRKG